MKAGIHPEYHEVTIQCVCGATYKTRSTSNINKIDICAACHPFYSGKEKLIDTEGRIEKFQKKFGTSYSSKITKAKEKAKK
jgi:large subunit ribosomal protein L31